MSPQRVKRLGYWHAGGSIESRSGQISRQRAIELFAFYAHEAISGSERGDAGGAIYCARCSLEIADAVIESEIWNRSAAPAGVRATREFSGVWLRNAFIVKKLLNILDRLERS
jgi:hypothetical protein